MVTDRESFPEQQCWTDENDGSAGKAQTQGSTTGAATVRDRRRYIHNAKVAKGCESDMSDER
jgi:hypothetical protein